MKHSVAFIAMAAAVAQSAMAAPQAPAFFGKQGIQVLAHQTGPGGLNVWQVQRGATKTVLYTMPDNKVLLSAVLWDATTGSNLSDAFIKSDMAVEAGGSLVAAPAPAAVVPTGSPTKMSEAIKGIASLEGIKEGRAAADKTLYIMFDPRCGYCHNVYQKTRAFVKAGGTIKWIPTTILGDKFEGAKQVADILQASSPSVAMGQVMTSSQRRGSLTPSSATQKAIADNEAYFFAAFKKNPGAGMAGVPVAFFETKAGAPQMVGGVDDDALLAQIYSDIKK